MMDSQLNKHVLFRLIPIGIVSLLLISCSIFKKNIDFYAYEMHTKIITAANTLNCKGYSLDDSSGNFILCFTDKQIHIIDIAKDSTILTMDKPKEINYYYSISFPSQSCFSIFSDTVFWVYSNKTLQRFPINSNIAGFRVFRVTPSQYFKNLDLIVFNILPNNAKTYPKEKEYAWPAFGTLDLKTGKTEMLNIVAPKKYWGKKYDIPYIYTSQVDSTILISYGLDEHIIEYNVCQKSATTKLVYYPKNDLNPANYSHLKGAEARDLIQKSWTIFDSYLNVFLDKKENTYYRIYKPALPLKTNKGIYLTNDNKAQYVIKYKDGKSYYYKLPMGIFTLRFDWHFANTNGQVHYIKQIKTTNNEHPYQMEYYTFDFYDFQ